MLQKRRDRSNSELKFIKEIEILDEVFTLDISDKMLKTELNQNKGELEELRDIRLKGSFIRSQIKDYNLNEKPNKYFLNLENLNFISKNIKELQLDNGTNITNPKDILEEMRRFYQS